MTTTDNPALIEALLGAAPRVPESTEVIAVRRYTVAENEKRMDAFLDAVGSPIGRGGERGYRSEDRGRTSIRMPRGARATVHHASGALKYQSGLGPVDAAFEQVTPDDELLKMVSAVADTTGLVGWAGANASIDFERLWKIKGQAVDLDSRMTDATLFRAIGAYRHSIGGVPVLGPASASFSVAGDGSLDSASLLLRESAGETIDEVRVRDPKDAALAVVDQLATLAGRSSLSLDKAATVQWVRFGYLSLSKRTSQRLLEPVFMSLVDIEHGEESQGYLLVSPAAEKSYLPWCRGGAEAYPALSQRIASARRNQSEKRLTPDHRAA